MGRLIDADILIAELKESASHHCNNPREDSLLQRDRVIVRAQPTVEAIPKADYENRLKADLEAILVELQSEIEEYKRDLSNKDITKDHEDFDHNNLIEVISGNIQQKINALKEK